MTTLNEVAEELEYKITQFCTNHTSLTPALWSVFYGDQEKLPKRLTICVEPNIKRNSLRNATRGITREYELYVIVYYTNLNEGGIFSRKGADKFAEEIEAELNNDSSLGGRLMHCYVTEVASGYSNKEGTVVKAARLTFAGEVTDRLPS